MNNKIKENNFYLKILIFLFTSIIISSSSEAKESLIYLRSNDVDSLDPGEATDFYSAEVISNIFEGLVKLKKNTFTVEPCLAVKWEIKENNSKWLFYLRKGVKFHNGETYNSRAVVYSFLTRMQRKDKRYNKWNFLYSFISSVKALDEYKVEFTLTKPYMPFLTTLAETTNYIISPSSYREKGFKPIGTGPFKFSERIRGKSLSIEKNYNYWGENAKISKVIFKVIKDPGWRILQIKNKNADIIPIRSSREYNELIGIKDTRFISTPSLSIYYLVFNTRKKPFNKLKVRKAIAHLINKKGVVKSIFQKLAINATTPLPPHIFGFNKKINDYSFDINKAKNLLEKAGYKKGFATTLHSSIGPIFLNEIVNRFIINAKKINIKINKKKLSFTELREVANRGEHNLLILGWTAGPDPDLFLFPHFSLKKGNFNRSFYNNPVLVEILEMARETFSWPERKKLYLKAQEIIHRDVPCVPLFHLYIVKAYNSKMKNLKLNQLGFIIFKDLYYKEK